MSLYTEADDRQFASAIHLGLTWRELARTAATNLAAADRIAQRAAAGPRVSERRKQRARVEAHAHLVTAGLHAGLAWQIRTGEDGMLPLRVTATTVRTLRMHVEAMVRRPEWLAILRHQVATLQGDGAERADHPVADRPSGHEPERVEHDHATSPER